MIDAKKISEAFGSDEEIGGAFKKDPYNVLINICGKSFLNADKIIISVDPQFEKTELRCSYLMLDVLDKNEQESGSTRLNGNDLYFYIQNELNYPELLPLVVPTAQKSELIYFDEATKDLAKMNTYLGECKIADFIKTKLANNHVLDIDWTKYTKFDDGSELTAEQSNALKLFCEKDFILLTGSAGCGKTKSLQAILDLCDDNKLTYSLFAFTGAASLRITEATHRPASTIHRPYYQEREFDSDVIVCDEFSMDDIEAICMLLSMISNPNAKVIFVGDNFQLLPIGCGNPFNDIINSHSAPNNTLTQVFRYNSSGLLFVATNVRKGIDFFENEIVKKEGNVYKVYNNYRFYDVDEDDIVDTVVQVYTEYLKKYKPKDILTTSPFNVGDCGTYAINNIIQNIVNPSKPNEPCLTRKIGQITINFRVGDKVINKKNDYKALTLESYQMIEESGGLLSADDVPHTTVFNGQIGYIRDLNEKYCTIQFDEELLVFDKNKMAHDVLLGYCISVHSSQGGSAKATLNIVSEKHRRMHNRNIFYVAGTRAEEIHTDIGSVKAFKEGIKIDGNKQRDTFLKELLTEEQGLDN
jgi:ATP-dependent exoDNAse (exonuclease V) alpha subunit